MTDKKFLKHYYEKEVPVQCITFLKKIFCVCCELVIKIIMHEAFYRDVLDMNISNSCSLFLFVRFSWMAWPTVRCSRHRTTRCVSVAWPAPGSMRSSWRCTATELTAQHKNQTNWYSRSSSSLLIILYIWLKNSDFFWQI